MVMGVEKAMDVLAKDSSLMGYFIVADDTSTNGYKVIYSDGLENIILKKR